MRLRMDAHEHEKNGCCCRAFIIHYPPMIGVITFTMQIFPLPFRSIINCRQFMTSGLLLILKVGVCEFGADLARAFGPVSYICVRRDGRLEGPGRANGVFVGSEIINFCVWLAAIIAL